MKTLRFFLSLCALALAGCATSYHSDPVMPTITSLEVKESARASHLVIDDPNRVAALRLLVDRLPGHWAPTMVDNQAIEASADLKNGDTVIGRIYLSQFWVGLQIPATTAAPDAKTTIMRVKHASKDDWLPIAVQAGM